MRNGNQGLADHILLVGIDGLRPDCITPAHTPNLHALLERAAVMPNHRSMFPTETRTNLATLATGGSAGDHGIVANYFFDRDRARREPIDTKSGSDILYLARHRGGEAVETPALASCLSAAGGTSALLSTGSEGAFRLLASGARVDGHMTFSPRWPAATYPPAERIRLFPRFGAERRSDVPACLVDAFLDHIWPARAPKLATLWFAEGDKASHVHGVGSPQHLDTLEEIDRQLGRLVDWRESCNERERIAIAVLSDHGHVTIGEAVSVVDTLAKAGFNASWTYDEAADVVLAAGLSPGLWVRRRDPARLADITAALTAQPWCGLVFSHGANGDTDGAIDGTFAHASVLADHPWSPDLRITFRGDGGVNRFGVPGSTPAELGLGRLGVGSGHHGGLHPAEIACLFAVEGAAFVPGRHNTAWSRTADVMPTLLAALGVSTPSDRTGRVLPELLDSGGQTAPAPQPEILTKRAGDAIHHLRRVHVGDAIYVDCAWSTPSIPPSQQQETS